ncbi:ribose 5-phosphate isomerase B [Balneicella halophila]|uniref:Ribose 5-phosphate isomerase B n=1 Tax=Balneicella halophila TaxID=1537566 RepID=A0A7L4URA2_BALHA|nr:ribose 5-phosphate isomerase B [Balneicella halophila]PVX52042.1 ribose 5-phosphate isomerase B [Balneicella halophila]
MKIGIAADHAGVGYKDKIKKYLENKGFDVTDFGTNGTDSVDYPDFAHQLGKAIDDGVCDKGVVICGSGNGITMTVNKHQNVRAALCWSKQLAELARQHNNANVLGLPARFIAYELAEEITEVFFTTDFEGGRHERRVNKIACS